MDSNTHIVIHGWMRNELNLKGNDLLVYAIIYGFSQAENQRYTGGIQYLADWCGATRQGITKNLKNLLDLGLIFKEDDVNSVTYYVNSVYTGCKLSLHNNISNTINSITVKSNVLSKDNTNTTDFLGSLPKSKKKKDNLYDKCIAMINDFTNIDSIHKLLVTYLNMRLEIKDKPLYANMWKGMLDKLDTVCTENNLKYEEVIQQSIDKGYLSFYPVKKYNKSDNKFGELNGSVVSQGYTDDELSEIHKISKELEANGEKAYF